MSGVGGLGRLSYGGRVVGDQCLAERIAVHTDSQTIDEPALVQFAQNAQYASGTVTLLDAVLLSVWSQLAEARHTPRQFVDVLHGEVHARLLGHGQQVEHGIGRAPHSDVERHSVQEGLAGGNAAGQD